MAAKRTRGRGQTALTLDAEDDAGTLTALPGVSARRRPGPTEAAVAASIRAARGEAKADPRWAGAESLARSLARGVDRARDAGDPYALAQLGPRLLEALRELGLTPPPRPESGGKLEELLSSLSEPE